MDKLYFLIDTTEVYPSDLAYREFEMYDTLQDAVNSADESEVVVEVTISKTYEVKETKSATVLKDYVKSTVVKKPTTKKKGAK